MQPEYKDAVTVIGTSRFVGPISQGQRIDFSWTKFSILRPDQPSRRPMKRLLATLENLQAAHVAAIFVYFIPETAYAPGSWNFTFFYANSTASTARYNSFLVTSNNIEYDEYDFCQKIIHFWTWTISIDFFFFLHTLLQLSIYLPATKIGLGVIILPGYKVK